MYFKYCSKVFEIPIQNATICDQSIILASYVCPQNFQVATMLLASYVKTTFSFLLIYRGISRAKLELLLWRHLITLIYCNVIIWLTRAFDCFIRVTCINLIILIENFDF